jgi:hypothetical protein
MATVRCNNSGTDGATFVGFPSGSYTASLEARDATNQIRFRASVPVVVNGQDVSVQVKLEPVMSGSPGEVRVKWSFPPLSVAQRPTCAQATMTRVKVSVNGGAAQEVNCSVGEPSGSGFRISNLSGTVRVALEASDMTGFVYFSKEERVVPSAMGSTDVTVALEWAVGSLPVRWEFRESGQAKSCAQVGVTSVYLNLRTSTGQFLYPGAGAEVTCNDAMTGQATVFPYLPPGSFDVFFQAVGSSMRLFKTDQTNPPKVTVRAGEFPMLSAATPVYVLVP